MSENIKYQIKGEICKFNDTIFSIIKEIDQKLDLDEETFTIIENSNKLLIFCTVKNFEAKKVGDPVCVIYNEGANREPDTQPVYYGRSLAQYRKVYEKSTGRCLIINKKKPDQFLPEDALWYYKINGHVIFENPDGSLGVSRNDGV
ncbi:MAG: hypothetical protein KJ737_03875 [Proteobacteria bacterium]|nr:hypothetical protein [Pseudomonadota bacterium]